MVLEVTPDALAPTGATPTAVMSNPAIPRLTIADEPIRLNM
jgi:hypothetical protein